MSVRVDLTMFARVRRTMSVHASFTMSVLVLVPHDVCTYQTYAVCTRLVPLDACMCLAHDVCTCPSSSRRLYVSASCCLHLSQCVVMSVPVCLTMSARVCRVLVSSTTNMHAFATNAIEYLHRYNFDGLDVDWEFPADRGSPAGDKHRFTQLLQVRITYLQHELLMDFIFRPSGCRQHLGLTVCCKLLDLAPPPANGIQFLLHCPPSGLPRCSSELLDLPGPRGTSLRESPFHSAFMCLGHIKAE